MTITKTRIEITPTRAALGAVVTGVDASRPVVEPEVILQLKQAWRDRHLLIFKNQQLTDAQLLAFANYFGDIFQQPAYIREGETELFLPPLVLTLSNASYEESSVNLQPGNRELLPHIDHQLSDCGNTYNNPSLSINTVGAKAIFSTGIIRQLPITARNLMPTPPAC